MLHLPTIKKHNLMTSIFSLEALHFWLMTCIFWSIICIFWSMTDIFCRWLTFFVDDFDTDHFFTHLRKTISKSDVFEFIILSNSKEFHNIILICYFIERLAVAKNRPRLHTTYRGTNTFRLRKDTSTQALH